MDIAELGIRADSREVVKATKDLDAIKRSAGPAAKGVMKTGTLSCGQKSKSAPK